MTDKSGRARLGRRVIAPVLAVVVLAAGAYLWLDTNLFGREDVCGGLVSSGSAEAVFPHSGRISDRAGLDDSSSDRIAFTCTVESSSFLLGPETEYLKISGSRERGDFPFSEYGRWPSPATVSFFSGGATGGVGSDHGWVLLPDACTTTDGPAIIEGYAPEGSDSVKFARLLTEVANNTAKRGDCASEKPLTAPQTLGTAPEPHRVQEGAVCGLTALEFPGPKAQARADVTETVQDSAGPTWSCEVDDHATYAVTQEPRLVAGIRSSPRFTEQPRVAGLQVMGFDPTHVVADCAGIPTYFSMEVHQGYTSALEKPGAPSLRGLYDNFVDIVGERFGCGTS
ncbi:hypothetical protein JL475_32890 [Streptomyces sp. M2CJ-2]|uniref:hypothetical protein n=1 Tax=Streptomyces sp. M2CJ-2 TaxID=2803948 RepID=UPI0019265E68|nr:hypothetical protein [Streptomyces sp. M2CJ-2]MBL3670682.1 hypothetical protein [Streptomyces sp. M2CJ-2]